jgi:Protein of unknown function (DUF2855)
MSDWSLLVDRDDYRSTRLIEPDAVVLQDGQARLRVDAFGLTANNISYAAAGDMIGYWTFFPAPDLSDGVNWGRVPVWGFADVVESRRDGVEEGERLYGYLPMSTTLVIEPTHVRPGHLTDGSAHRSELPRVYNRYVRCAADPGYDPALEAEQMLYRPLFLTSFLIDDFLADNAYFGSRAVVLGSASSKTAFGAAHLLHQRGNVEVVGLTSRGNAGFVTGLGCYDTVLRYDELGRLPSGPATFVDMSGDGAVVRAVHERYGDDLAASYIVGLTHWEDRTSDTTPLPGPAQQFFFAPSQIEKRNGDWGPGVLDARFAEAWHPFLDEVASRVTIQHGHGSDALAAAYSELLEGRTPPDTAHVLHP